MEDGDSFDKWMEDVRNSRNQCHAFDVNLLNQSKVMHISLADLEKKMEPGRFRIDIQNARYECFFHCKQNVRPINLYVFYTGARPPIREHDQPIFPRWSYYTTLETYEEGAILCIEDPMIYRYPDLKIGYYWGTGRDSYIELSLEIVKAISRRYGIPCSHVTFSGSSAGGYASIYACAVMSGSSCVVVNPIVFPQQCIFAEQFKFKEITGLDLGKSDPLGRNDLPFMIRNSSSNFCVLFNMQDRLGMQRHCFPLCRKLGTLGGYGITKHENVLLWIYDAQGIPDPHNSVETPSLFLAIDYIAKRFSFDGLTKDVRKLVFMVNECWCDLYKLKSYRSIQDKIK